MATNAQEAGTQVADWLKDIVDAASELGYGVVEIGKKHVKLSPLGANRGLDVKLTGYFVSGDAIRQLLKKVRE